MQITLYSCKILINFKFFSTYFRKIHKYNILRKISLAGTEMLLADGWVDRQNDGTKLIVDFRNFANVPKG